jgi:sigma-B regulation protein RsbU (phosphoserine phosphatase)
LQWYRLLAVTFLLTAFIEAGQVAAAYHILVHGAEMARVPGTLRGATREWGAGGNHFRWRVLAFEGKPLTGYWQFEDAANSRRPGDEITFTMESPQGRTEDVRMRAVPRTIAGPARISFLATSLFLPVFCLLLAFGVAAIRVRDPHAWILLALLLSFAEMARGDFLWFWPARDFAALTAGFLSDSWPVWMMLFGICFPNRLRFDVKHPWAKWVLIASIATIAASGEVIAFLWRHDIDGASHFRLVILTAFQVQSVLAMMAISVLPASMGRRAFAERDRDARRRVMLLWAGTAVSLTPTLGIALYALATGRDFAYAPVPTWYRITAISMLALFPVTLAYVIVVQRAMNLRVVLRQGMKYALARGGLRVMQGAVVGLAVYVVMSGGPHQTVRVLVLIAVVVALQKSVPTRVSAMLDRRFFREAYSAELVLNQLSEEVRSFTETGPLLKMVTTRLADTLHVAKTCVLLKEEKNYCLAAAAGEQMPEVRCLPQSARTIGQVRETRKPVVLYFDQPDSLPSGIDAEEQRRLEALGAQVLLPLAGREELAGVIVLGPKLSEEPYTKSDLGLLQSVATQTGLALENSELLARLSAEAARRERLNRDLEIAREVQERLFPQSYPPIEGIDYAGYCRPAQGIGGDYYDFVPLRDGSLGIAIGDISGKGVAAALLMANLQASLRGQTLAEVAELPVLMRNINQMMYEASLSNKYATFFYGEYCPHSQRLDYVNAGHNAPMVLRDEECLRLEATGPVVGLLNQASFEAGHIDLMPGDLLIGFTDGISEAQSGDEQEWQEERLLDALRRARGCCARNVIETVFTEADAFTEGAPQFDDMTLVVVKVTS